MHELIYTSASKGLTSGSRGFCTVAATKSMAKSLSKKLEGLSGYNHVYDPGNSNNPVNFSFVTLKDSRQTHYVLSRICDAGLDYTQRSNKFAHHIALAKSELPSAGPAWALQSSGSFKVAWGDAQTPYHIDDSSFPDGNVATAVCTSWQSLLGDAGYGGIIAGQLADRAIKDMVIAYELGTDILGLISESLAIIPHNKRWQATFSTFAGKPNANYTCKLRCVLVGSEEAQKAAGNKRVRFLDLTNPAPIEHENEYVVAARSGQIAQPDVAPTPVEQPKRWVEETPVDDGLQQVTQVPSILSTDDVDLVEPEPTVSRPTSIFDDSYEAGGIAPPPLPRQGGRGFGRIVVGLSAVALLMLVLCGGGGGAYYYVLTQRSARPDVDDLIARNPTKVDEDGGKSENKSDEGDGKSDEGDGKPDEGDGKPDKGDDKPDKGDDKPDKGDDKPDKGDGKPAMEKAAMDIKEIQQDFENAKATLDEHINNDDNFKKSDKTYIFLPNTGPSATQISDQQDKLGATSKAGKELEDKFLALREQSFKGGVLPKEDQGAAAIVDGIATKLLGQYGVEYPKLEKILELAQDRIEYLSHAENLLKKSKKDFDDLLVRVNKVNSQRATDLKDEITEKIKFIADILKTGKNKRDGLRAAVTDARKVPTLADKQQTIATSLQKDTYYNLIVEMFTGNPLSWLPNREFTPADGLKNYVLLTADLNGKRNELQFMSNTAINFPGIKVNPWLRHFVSRGSAKNVPANDKTNIYPICWLGISIENNEAKLKPEGGKYIARLDTPQIGIELEISEFTPGMSSQQNTEFFKLFVVTKERTPTDVKRALLALNGKLFFTYGNLGSKNLKKLPVNFKSGVEKIGVNFGPRPKGYMLVDTSANKPADIPLDSKFQWMINMGKWNHSEGKVERLKIQYPTEEPQNRQAINLGRIDDTNKAGDEFIMVHHDSAMIVQSEAFEYDNADFNSYLLWKLVQEPMPLLNTLQNPKPFIEHIKAKIKSDLPEPIAKYLDEPTFNNSFRNALKSIGMADKVLDSGYAALADTVWKGQQTDWWKQYINAGGPSNQNNRFKNKQITIESYPICPHLKLFNESKGPAWFQAQLAFEKNRVPKPQENKAQYDQRVKPFITTRTMKYNELLSSWATNFKKYYIAVLHANIKSKLSQSNSSNLFIKKQQMIQSFELQVLNSEGEPLEPIYKLALTDP